MAGLRDFSLDRWNDIANGDLTVAGLMNTDSEGAWEMIENIDCAGIHPVHAGALPEPVAELCRRANRH